MILTPLKVTSQQSCSVGQSLQFGLFHDSMWLCSDDEPRAEEYHKAEAALFLLLLWSSTVSVVSRPPLRRCPLECNFGTALFPGFLNRQTEWTRRQAHVHIHIHGYLFIYLGRRSNNYEFIVILPILIPFPKVFSLFMEIPLSTSAYLTKFLTYNKSATITTPFDA